MGTPCPPKAPKDQGRLVADICPSGAALPARLWPLRVPGQGHCLLVARGRGPGPCWVGPALSSHAHMTPQVPREGAQREAAGTGGTHTPVPDP